MKSSAFYKIFSIISSVVLLSFVLFPKIEVAYASALTSISIGLSDATTAVEPSYNIQFVTPTGVADSATITITFPAAFTDVAGIAFGDMAITHGAGGAYTLGTAIVLAGDCSDTSKWSATASGQVITITACSSATANVVAAGGVRIQIDSAPGITNPAAASYSIDVAGTFGDVGSAVVTVLSDSSVTVTATVDAADTLTFSINDTAIGFGTLSALSAKYATADASGSYTPTSAHTLTAASTGTYSVTVTGDTLEIGGVDPSITAITAAGGAASIPGTEQFGVNISASGGSGVVDSDYDGATFYYGGTSSPPPSEVAACSATCSSTTTYTASYLANITASTDDGSYSATLTYSATGTF